MEPTHPARKSWLALECAALFIGLPLMGALSGLPLPVIPMLLLTATGCAMALRFHHKVRLRDLLRTPVPAREWRRVLGLYLVAIVVLTGLLWVIKPAAMFGLVRHHPGVWLLIMFAYPIVSVFPQELIYRAFFFERYHLLFGRGFGLVLASAVLFGFAHVLFHNWPSILLSSIGGLIFGRTYQRTSSLSLACIEHSLYGCAAFTLGYGEFFFDSTMRLYK